MGAGSLTLKGHRGSVDAELVAPKTPGGRPDIKPFKWEGDIDETYALHDIARNGSTIMFKVDPIHDHLAGSCTPTRVAKIARTTLYECTIVGFSWHIIAELPELHHPLVLDVKPGILDTMSGAAKPELGQRKVSEAKPKPYVARYSPIAARSTSRRGSGSARCGRAQLRFTGLLAPEGISSPRMFDAPHLERTTKASTTG